MATEYVVLRRVISEPVGEATSEEAWAEAGRATALNDIAAIKAVAKDTQTDLGEGAVAVPVRNWRPRKPEERVERRTLWS